MILRLIADWLWEYSSHTLKLRDEYERLRVEWSQARAAVVDAGVAAEKQRQEDRALIEERTALARAAAEVKLTLQGENRALLTQLEELSARAQRAEDRERAMMHMMLNVEFQRKFGITPFPESVHIPEGKLRSSTESAAMETGYVNASDLVAQMCRQELEKARTPQPEDRHAGSN